MKYTLELPIDRPLAEVWRAFDDRQNLSKWQPSLVKVEAIGGTPGQPGAVSRLTFEENGRQFFLMETITRRDEPGQLDTLYENEFAANTVSNRFSELGPAQTLWIVETEYRFKTIIMRILGLLLKKNFVARTQREMERFKAMAESQQGRSRSDLDGGINPSDFVQLTADSDNSYRSSWSPDGEHILFASPRPDILDPTGLTIDSGGQDS